MMKQNKQSGFTLIETLVAILILTMTVGALLSLTANGFFTVRYARNQIIADNLTQEALEYVRNMRDNEYMQGGNWQSFLDKMNVNSLGQTSTYVSGNASTHQGCFGTNGCYVDPYTYDPSERFKACSSTCPYIAYYPSQYLYGYGGATYYFPQADGYETTYIRTLKVQESPTDPNQVVVTVTMSWMNGNSRRTVSQSIVLADWHV